MTVTKKHVKRIAACLLSAAMAVSMMTPATVAFAQPADHAVVAEQTAALVTASGTVEDFVRRLYANLLGRDADESGLKAWTDALTNKTSTGADVVYGFVYSKEFQANPLSNEDFVKALYETILGREADAEGLASWTGVLEKGYTRKKVLSGFLNSEEMKALCEALDILPGEFYSDAPADENNDITQFVIRLYRNVLGREAEEDGVNAWAKALLEGGSGAEVAGKFFKSEEFAKRRLSDEDFVRTAYLTLLNREADEGGLAAWIKVLADGASREATRETVVKGFVKSLEFARLCKTYRINAGTEIYDKIKDGLSIQTFPCSTTAEFTELFRKQEAETPEKIYYHPYTGLFVEKVAGGRELYTYIADETPHCASSVFVAIPDGELPETFLMETGWAELADEFHFLLHALTPAGTWGEEADELAYMGAAFAMGSRTVNYSPYTGNYYFVGYGKGGQYVQQYVMSAPDNASGLLVVDGNDIDLAYLDQMRETPATDPDKSVADINVPVWLVDPVRDASNIDKVLDYWYTANDVDRDTICMDPGMSEPTYVGHQNMLSTEDFINAYPLGTVRMTIGTIDPSDKNFTSYAWMTFLSKTQRYRSLAGNDLRPAFDPDALGITKEERTIDGYSRYWLEYVPEHVKNNPSEAVPLVIALHGAGQCAEAYAPYSEWFKVAKEANFIVVFPTAYPYSENNGMARPIHNDCWDESRPSDISFWRQIIADVSARYSVDASMVYATGHSNGGNSSAMIAGEMSDVITAVGISAGRYRNAYGKVTDDVATLHPMASTYKVPVMQLVGTKDGGAYKSATMISTMNYWMQRNEIVNADDPLQYKTAGYNHAIWLDKDNVPMVHYVVIDDKVHTTTPSESRMFWYEFLSHYKRAEDGSIKYMQDDSFSINDQWVMENN